MKPIITAYDWVPPFARGQVRDLRIRWALEEVGQAYDVLYLKQGEQKEAPHRARQPFGQVPTYQEDELVLFESGAIVLHVADRFPGLLPAGPDARARAVQWIFAAANTIEPRTFDYVQAAVFEANEPWSAPRLPGVAERLHERLRDVGARLGDGDWLGGDAFTAGDLAVISSLRMLDAEGPLGDHPSLVAYVARGEARPPFGRALAAQLAGFTGEPPAHLRAWLEQQQQKEGETG